MAEQGAHASNDWTEQRVEASGSIGTCAGHTSEAAVETYVGRGGVEPRAEPDKDDGRQEKKNEAGALSATPESSVRTGQTFAPGQKPLSAITLRSGIRRTRPKL